MENKLLQINDIYAKYRTIDNDVLAINGVSLELNRGESLGLVGETGAGKTTLALAIMGLLPSGVGEVYHGDIIFKGNNLLKVGEKKMRDVRGKQISMIFQDPMTSLNPVFTVGDQIAEVLELHGEKHPDERVDEILNLVGIDSNRKSCYPHQFSGGMKQRIVIAMALACEPDLLIADEPTTALDVTIQAQVLAMIDDIQKKLGTAMILITHDLGVVAETCDKVAIMYAGEIVEAGTLEQIFDKGRAHHPYTVGLFGSIPDLASTKKRLEPIYGMTPDPSDLPEGCYFSPRCSKCMEICKRQAADHVVGEDGHMLKCHLFDKAAKEDVQ
jgi:peptide/nickel transport system ATP-binding protein